MVKVQRIDMWTADKGGSALQGSVFFAMSQGRPADEDHTISRTILQSFAGAIRRTSE